MFTNFKMMRSHSNLTEQKTIETSKYLKRNSYSVKKKKNCQKCPIYCAKLVIFIS